jgi:hypothetical protein
MRNLDKQRLLRKKAHLQGSIKEGDCPTAVSVRKPKQKRKRAKGSSLTNWLGNHLLQDERGARTSSIAFLHREWLCPWMGTIDSCHGSSLFW